MPTTFPVRVDLQIFNPAEQSNTNHRWVAALSLAHRQDLTFCRCGNNEIALSIKHYGRDTDNSHYGLARWPETGLAHDPDCQYFDDDSDAAVSIGHLPAFDEIGEGKIRAHLAVGLGLGAATLTTDDVPSPSKSGSKSTRSRASEAALLQKLWRLASLNVYHGSLRHWFGAVFSALKAADRIVVSRHGATLADHLLVGASSSDKLATAHNLRVLQRCADSPSRLFVLGRMRKYEASKARCLLPLKEFHGLPKILVQTGQLDRFVAKRPFLLNLLSEPTGFVVVLVCIEPDGRDWWKVVSLTGISTTTNLIPADSSFEVEFEGYLVEHARKFIKPMINSEVDHDANRPDFILLDTQPRTRCEVWGMQTAEYLSGKAQRIATYAKRGQKLVSWSANPREPFPALPKPAPAPAAATKAAWYLAGAVALE
jgi:hypothetical protein